MRNVRSSLDVGKLFYIVGVFSQNKNKKKTKINAYSQFFYLQFNSYTLSM